MKKIGITGSIASGKTTASKILSSKKGPLFSADVVVKELYKKKFFKNLVCRKLNISNASNIKKKLITKILKDKSNITKLEKVIHPIVRKEMFKFVKKNKKKKLLFFEIPLLIESNLISKFDFIIFIKARRSIRLKRFISKGGNVKLFNMLDKKQLSDTKKIQFCDYVVVNEKNIKFLKASLSNIFD